MYNKKKFSKKMLSKNITKKMVVPREENYLFFVYWQKFNKNGVF